MPTTAYIPYCGPPPAPGAATWNLDPVLLAAFAASAILYAGGARAAGATRGERACFAAGWLVLALAFVSPLCQIGVALFSARAGQHVLATLVAAPLIVRGRGGLVFRALRPHLPRVRRHGPASASMNAGKSAPTAALALGPALFAAALWTWHLGPPYDATLTSDAIYWAMHASLFGAALLLWWGLLRAPRDLGFAAILVALATGLQMTLLGVALTFAEGAWFASHLATTAAWGLTPLEDQQLGGLVMWMPGMVLMLANALLAFAAALRGLEARAPGWSGPDGR
jgi:putative membrane protein